MSKGGGQTQQVQSNEPWGPAQGHLRSIFGQASNIYGGPVGFNPQQYLAANPDVAAAVARGETNPLLHYNLFGQFENRPGVPANPTPPTGQSQATQNLQQSIVNRATQGSPLLGAAQSEAQKTLSGGYLSPNSNPFLRDTVNQALGDVRAMVNSNFTSDNFGNSAHQEFLTKQLANTALPMYMQNFNNERQRMAQLSALAPSIASADLGELVTGLSVSRMADQAPWEHLFNYQRAISGAGGGTSTTSQDLYSNPVAGALGGGLAGAGIVSMLGKNMMLPSAAGPWGAALGAGLGLLGSL